MKYPSASEVLAELETAKQSKEGNWWEYLISIPTDKLVDGQGKLQILYKGKPLYLRAKEEQVVMGSTGNSMYDYSSSVKLGNGDAYKVVEPITEIVSQTAFGADSTATELTTRAKEYNDSKYLDLKLYPSYVTIRDKEGISEETLTDEDLKTPRKVNQVFKVGSKVSCVVIVGLYVSEKYVSVKASIGSQSYADQRKVKTHFTFTQLKDMFDIDLEDDDDIDIE